MEITLKITGLEALTAAIEKLAVALSCQIASSVGPTVPSQAVMAVSQPQAPAIQPVPPAEQQPQTLPQAAPVTAPPEYSAAQLQQAAADLVKAGKQPQCFALLQKYGVNRLDMLPQDQFGAFAADLRALGAKL